MTCIVGIEDPAGAVLGGDAVHTAGWRRTNSAEAKIQRSGPALLGVTGSSRVAQVITYATRSIDWGPDTLDWMVNGLVPVLRKALKDAGALSVDKGVEELVGSSAMIVALGPRIFTVWSDLQVESAARGYQAVGSGDQVAVGALYVSGLTSTPVAAEERAVLALEAASEHMASVGPPFTILRTGIE